LSDPTIEDGEVSWDVLGLPVNGTLTAPRDEKVHSAVVFVSGSGPTDRDWCSPLLSGKNGSAKLLAQRLAGEGYVTLRYDKLGSGPRAKEDAKKLAGRVSMQGYVDQLAGAVMTLISEKNIDKERLFVLGNSEGCIHAVNYQLQANENRFRGLVLTGAPGRSVGEVARSQLLEQMKFLHSAGGTTGFLIRLVSKLKPLPDIEATMKHYDDAIAEFVAGRPMHPDPSLPKGIKRLLLSLETPANQPFARELWTYTLSEKLSHISDPTLIVIGKKDIQVDWKVDGNALEGATSGKSSVTFSYPENANHILKHEEKPREKLNARYVSKHYNSPDATLDEEAASSILGWLGRQGASSSSGLTS
jgi:uncharacterized protein